MDGGARGDVKEYDAAMAVLSRDKDVRDSNRRGVWSRVAVETTTTTSFSSVGWGAVGEAYKGIHGGLFDQRGK